MLNGNRSRASYSFTYSIRKTSSSFNSRFMHGSFCSIFFTRAQSVKRRMLLGYQENIIIQTCSPLPILSLSGVRRVRVDRYDWFSQFFHFLCEFFLSTWCYFRSLRNVSNHLGLRLRGFFLPTFIVAISLTTLF